MREFNSNEKIKKDVEREVPRTPNYENFKAIVLNDIRFKPGRVSVNIVGQKKCKHSNGIILYTREGDQIKYFCAQKKDTIEYYIFITGKYNDKQLYTIFSLMTYEERMRLLDHADNFRILWDDLWVNHKSKLYREEYENAYRIFSQVRPYLSKLIYYSCSLTLEPEWCWPKGQKNADEKMDLYKGSLRAAVREFREETRINLQVDISKNYRSYVEHYRGSNNFIYETTYFLIEVPKKLKFPEPIIKEKGIRSQCMSYDFEKFGWFAASEAPLNERRKADLKKIDEELKSQSI